VDGEHAKGEFFVPMATTEGTLVASYNRGMRLTREAGGVRTTVIDDAMQRAPIFVFRDARAARVFGKWVDQNFARSRRRPRKPQHRQAAQHRAVRALQDALAAVQLHHR